MGPRTEFEGWWELQQLMEWFLWADWCRVYYPQHTIISHVNERARTKIIRRRRLVVTKWVVLKNPVQNLKVGESSNSCWDGSRELIVIQLSAIDQRFHSNNKHDESNLQIAECNDYCEARTGTEDWKVIQWSMESFLRVAWISRTCHHQWDQVHERWVSDLKLIELQFKSTKFGNVSLSVQLHKICERSNGWRNGSREVIVVQIAAIKQWEESTLSRLYRLHSVDNGDNASQWPDEEMRSRTGIVDLWDIQWSMEWFPRVDWSSSCCQQGINYGRGVSSGDECKLITRCGEGMCDIHFSNEPSNASNKSPRVRTRITNEPVGVVGPVGAISGGVQVHQRRNCYKRTIREENVLHIDHWAYFEQLAQQQPTLPRAFQMLARSPGLPRGDQARAW